MIPSMRYDEEVQEPGAARLASVFEWKNRPRRDVAWGYVYATMLVLTLAGGIAAYANRDPNFYKYATHPDFFNSPANCPAGGSGRRLLGSPDGTFDVDSLSRAAGVFIAISAVGSLFVGLLFVQLVRRNATAMAYVAMVTQVAAPAAIAVVLFATKNPVGGAILLVIAAVTALCFYLYRDAMALVARLMGIAGRGLHENPALILMVVLAQFGLLALCVPLVMSLLLALTNGRVVPNPVAVAADGSGGCADSFGDAVPCCGWATDGWVAPYMAFASITVTWTTMLVFQVKVFSISSTVAQWYFAPQTSAPAPPGLLGRWSFASGSGGRVMTSLRHAMGPSFGSLCFGSAVLTLVQYLRQAAKQKLQGDGNGSGGFNFVACMLACILDCIASFIEFLTHFSTVRMAISGEALLTSAHHIFNLLTRNTLSTLGVWWLPGTILQACAFVLAGAWGALVWLVCAAYFAGKPDATLNSVVPGVLSFLFAWAVLSFFSSILLNVIDALYICYAMDRDARAVTHADVHQVYALLPCNVGGIVEQPDGGYAYGAPQQQQQQQPSYGGYPAYAAAGGGAPAYPQQPQAYSAGAPLLHSSSAQYVPPQVPPAPGGGKNPPYV